MDRSETTLQKIAADLKIFAEHERCACNTVFVLRMFLLTVGFQFVFARRLQELAVRVPLVGRLLRRILWWLTCLAFGSELALGAEVGGGLYMPHPYGVVVGVSRIGRNVTLLQNVTIGKRRSSSEALTVIGDNVAFGAGAVVLGPLTIGSHSAVGANSVLLQDVPEYSTAIGAPAKIQLKSNGAVITPK